MMRTIYYVQIYTVKGTRMIGCPAMGFAYADQALAEAQRLTRVSDRAGSPD